LSRAAPPVNPTSKGLTVSDYSRRNFLKTASISAAAVGAAAVVSPALMSSANADTVPAGPTHDGHFVAWVKDAKAGEIAVMVGDHTVIHQDKKLALQLARIAGKAPKS
jgi:hypothetical protein